MVGEGGEQVLSGGSVFLHPGHAEASFCKKKAHQLLPACEDITKVK